MHKQRLGIYKFGKALLDSGDLDPIYIMLHEADLPERLVQRWLLAYWWFYHAGVASRLARERGEGFYGLALRLAQTPGTPRGTERRHFRGQACLKSIQWFQKHYERPEQAVDAVAGCNTVQEVVAFVQEDWPLFGPWIGFKIADMLDRVLGIPIKFSGSDLKMYDTPTKGAKILCKRKGWDFGELGVPGVVRHLLVMFSKFKAPPDYQRSLNAQEIETILCKWKSHLGGHYPLGKDTREIRHALKGWGPLARRLRKHLPKEQA
jgi:hypothetical protein